MMPVIEPNPKAVSARAAVALVKVFSAVLKPVEAGLLKGALARSVDRHAPIFIIGAPRSGSTLLYKAMIDAFGFPFFNSLCARLYRAPYMGLLLSKLLGLAVPKGFDIKYGSMRGWGSPSECGAFWYRWFPRGLDVYAPSGTLSPESRAEIRQEIYGISARLGTSMVFKNLFNSMRIGSLVECFPDAVFIVCKRDPVQNALSLLRGRIEQTGDKQGWWTLPPRDVEALMKKPYPEQVAGQVHSLYKQIDQEAALHGRHRFLTVDYERFCEDVHGSMREIEAFLQGHDITAVVSLDGLPGTFDVVPVSGLDPKDEAAVGAAVLKLYDEQSHAKLDIPN